MCACVRGGGGGGEGWVFFGGGLTLAHGYRGDTAPPPPPPPPPHTHTHACTHAQKTHANRRQPLTPSPSTHRHALPLSCVRARCGNRPPRRPPPRRLPWPGRPALGPRGRREWRTRPRGAAGGGGHARLCVCCSFRGGGHAAGQGRGGLGGGTGGQWELGRPFWAVLIGPKFTQAMTRQVQQSANGSGLRWWIFIFWGGGGGGLK